MDDSVKEEETKEVEATNNKLSEEAKKWAEEKKAENSMRSAILVELLNTYVMQNTILKNRLKALSENQDINELCAISNCINECNTAFAKNFIDVALCKGRYIH